MTMKGTEIKLEDIQKANKIKAVDKDVPEEFAEVIFAKIDGFWIPQNPPEILDEDEFKDFNDVNMVECLTDAAYNIEVDILN